MPRFRKATAATRPAAGKQSAEFENCDVWLRPQPALPAVTHGTPPPCRKRAAWDVFIVVLSGFRQIGRAVFRTSDRSDNFEGYMADMSRPGSGGMEGGGAYNRHATLQAAGNTLALLHAQEAARRVDIDSGDEPIIIADYGSSQGKNSLAPMRTVIETLRSRTGTDRAFVVNHVDLPVNDFNALFRTLDSDPGSYTRGAPNVYACGVGRSFFQSVLPPGSVHFGWSAYAAQWLSCIPDVPVDHLWFARLNDPARSIFQQQAAQDWERFLALRAIELRPGGRLVIVCPGVGTCEAIGDHADAVIADMVREGAISAQERSRMVPACWLRLKQDYLAPFQRDGRFLNLTVEHCESMPQADPVWEQYQRDGHAETLAIKHAAFFRATFLPSLAAVLAGADDPEVRAIFADRLERGLMERLVREPTSTSAGVDTIVIAKVPAARRQTHSSNLGSVMPTADEAMIQ